MAGVLEVTAAVDVSGPLADGRAVAMLPALMDSIAEKIAAAAAADLRAWPMNKTGRARGNFASAVHEVRKGPGTVAVPGPMITAFTWAPWLEGVSRRNLSTSFAGYRLFRITAGRLNAGRAAEIAEAEVANYAAEIGGG